ncbi:MAG: hypothetical protein JWR61_5063 [Ferruginibacter sp.]|nr:hypothetical protein [Ferruginibacter sp.]
MHNAHYFFQKLPPACWMKTAGSHGNIYTFLSWGFLSLIVPSYHTLQHALSLRLQLFTYIAVCISSMKVL